MLLSPPGRGPILSFDFPLSRSAALARLAAFVPEAGQAYAAHRNDEHGPGRHLAVSRLSAALRRRLVSEAEVAGAVVAAHGAEAARSFLGEIFWRTYWKGWLERHPGLWGDWRRAVATLRSGALPACYAAALEGRTGIDAFDFWARELRETGYLHNWARMQFASIWIFTLGLPWELGAAFTFEHFVDADPASNTLSWRWVAGLHRGGRPYLADADLIARRTGGRFAPKGLAATAHVPRETSGEGAPAAIRVPRAIDPAMAAALLVTPEDLSLEAERPLAGLAVKRVIACRRLCRNAADIAAVAEGVQRAAEHWHAPATWVDDLEAAAALARHAGCAQIVTGYAAVGPVADALFASDAFGTLHLAEHRRDWDARAWPLCDKGYFALANHIPRLLREAVGDDRTVAAEG